MKRIQFPKLLAFASMLAVAAPLIAQQAAAPKPKPEETEVWTPVPAIVTPGATDAAPPSDAIVLFDGKNLDEWVSAQDHTPAQWIVADGTMMVKKAPGVGNIETKRRFKNYQIHSSTGFRRASPAAVRRAETAACSSPQPAPATTDTSCRF